MSEQHTIKHTIINARSINTLDLKFIKEELNKIINYTRSHNIELKYFDIIFKHYKFFSKDYVTNDYLDYILCQNKIYLNYLFDINYKNFEKFPSCIKNDKTFVLSKIANRGVLYKILPYTLQIDTDIIIAAVSNIGDMLKYVPMKYKTKNLCILACKKNHTALPHIPAKYFQDNNFIENCINNYIPIELNVHINRLDKNMILNYLDKIYISLDTLNNIKPLLYSDLDFAKKCLSICFKKSSINILSILDDSMEQLNPSGLVLESKFLILVEQLIIDTIELLPIYNDIYKFNVIKNIINKRNTLELIINKYPNLLCYVDDLELKYDPKLLNNSKIIIFRHCDNTIIEYFSNYKLQNIEFVKIFLKNNSIIYFLDWIDNLLIDKNIFFLMIKKFINMLKYIKNNRETSLVYESILEKSSLKIFDIFINNQNLNKDINIIFIIIKYILFYITDIKKINIFNSLITDEFINKYENKISKVALDGFYNYQIKLNKFNNNLQNFRFIINNKKLIIKTIKYYELITIINFTYDESFINELIQIEPNIIKYYWNTKNKFINNYNLMKKVISIKYYLYDNAHIDLKNDINFCLELINTCDIRILYRINKIMKNNLIFYKKLFDIRPSLLILLADDVLNHPEMVIKLITYRNIKN